MIDLIYNPWPWYIAGPLIGLMVPLLMVFGNRVLGVSSSLRHICAMCVPLDIKYFQYEWRNEKWNLSFVGGILIGGLIAGNWMMDDGKVEISPETISELSVLGVQQFDSFLPSDIFSWENLISVQGVVFMCLGGFLVGFGTRYANGCTSGHTISGLSNLQFGSLVASISFFVGGLLMTHLILPFIL